MSEIARYDKDKINVRWKGKTMIVEGKGKSVVERWIEWRKTECFSGITTHAELLNAYKVVTAAHGESTRYIDFIRGFSFSLFLQSSHRQGPLGEPMSPEEAEEGKPYFIKFRERGPLSCIWDIAGIDPKADNSCVEYVCEINPDFIFKPKEA